MIVVSGLSFYSGGGVWKKGIIIFVITMSGGAYQYIKIKASARRIEEGNRMRGVGAKPKVDKMTEYGKP